MTDFLRVCPHGSITVGCAACADAGRVARNSVSPFQAWYETNPIGDLVIHARPASESAHGQKEPSDA